MKLGLVADNSIKTICEHTKEVRVGIDELTEAVIVEDPRTHLNDIKCINTCNAVQNLLSRPDLEEAFLKELGIGGEYPTSFLYGFFSPAGFSELLEVSYSTRLMVGEVGPSIGFVQGTGIPATKEVFQAFPTIKEIEKALIELEYIGEITLGCTTNFQISRILFGHQTGMFALFTELSQLSPQANYEWCLGVGDACKLHEDGISTCTLLSNSPFPVPSPQQTTVIAPVAAERHLYRVEFGSHEVAYVATWGRDISEAKRRTRRTIENCVSFNPDLQYRVDYGFKEIFVLSQERYTKFGGQ